jgi:hypothetical protein
MILTQAYLKQMLHYDPETGVWTWRQSLSYNVKAGRVAGSLRSDGYRKIRIRGRAYYSGRLAWFYMTGEWPEEVDHKDRDPSNDRWSNLREATSSQNKYNRNDDGTLRGVYCSGGGKWWAMVGKDNYLGTFDTLEEAITARDAEALRLAGDFAILNTCS